MHRVICRDFNTLGLQSLGHATLQPMGAIMQKHLHDICLSKAGVSSADLRTGSTRLRMPERYAPLLTQEERSQY
jgi:hypothetical protein